MIAAPRRRRRGVEPALAHERGEQLGVVEHLVAAAEVGVLVGERVEAVRAAGDDLRHAAPRSSVATFSCAAAWKTYSLPIRRAGSPVQPSRGPRIAKSTPAAGSSRAVDSRGAARALVEGRRAADPVEDLGRRLARREHAHAEAARPVGALGLRAPPRVRGALDVAQHRLGLGREARLDHHEVAAQVDDVVDVLDRDRAGLDAGAAGHAVPDDLVGDRGGDQRRELVGLAPPASSAGPSREDLVAQAHDQQLRRERLAGRERRAGVLAAPALGAREGVEHLLPGQVGDRAGAEAQVLLVGVLVEAQRLEAPARAGAPEPDVDRGGRDVQVLGVGQVGEEARGSRATCAQTSTRSASRRRAVAAEQVREALRDRRPAGRELVQAERDPRRVPEQQRRHDPRRSRRGSGRPRAGGCPRSAAAAAPCGCTARRARRTSTSAAKTSTSSAYQPWRPSHGSVWWRSTIADHRDHDRRQQHAEAPEDERVHEPRARAARAACAGRARSSPRCAARRRGVAARARAAPRRAAAGRAAARGARTAARRPRSRRRARRAAGTDGYGAPSRRADRGADRGHDLVQVADHRVVGAGEDRRLGVGVDREQPLRALAARHVLGRAADPAGDVDLGRDLRAGLADLVGVRAPAGHRHRARAADRGAEQRRRAPRSARSPRPSRRRGRRRRRRARRRARCRRRRRADALERAHAQVRVGRAPA